MGDTCRQLCQETDATALLQVHRAIQARIGLEDRLEWDFFFLLKDLRNSASRLRSELLWWQREVEVLADDEAFALLAQRIQAYDYVQPLFPGETLSTGALPTLHHIGGVLARAVEARRAPGRDDLHPLPGGSWDPREKGP
jgi:hypothetical protein